MYVIGSAYASVDAQILQSGDKLALQISNSRTTTTQTTQSIRPPSSFLLEKTLRHQRLGICGAGCFERGTRRTSGRHSRLILNENQSARQLRRESFWAERAENTPEQNGQVGLVTMPFAVDAYETRPRVRPPTLAVGYPFAAAAASSPTKGPLLSLSQVAMDPGDSDSSHL
ncbi:unnamed protein product [Sphagnum troendelagicum]|jgi:hypothetical protein